MSAKYLINQFIDLMIFTLRGNSLNSDGNSMWFAANGGHFPKNAEKAQN
jgi:hypothetical protein